MYRYELHMHTKEASACAKDDIHAMLRHYASFGFSGVVVTNHFLGGNTCVDRSLPWEEVVAQYCAPYYAGLQTAKELGMDLFFGVEEGYGGGKEFLAYGIEPEFLLERPFLRGADISVWSREVHSVGGLLIYAHPFRDRWYVTDPNAMPDMSLADGVELYNFGNPPEQNEKAVAVFDKVDVIHTAGTDSHNAIFEYAWGVGFSEPVHTQGELVAALKRKEHTLLAER